MVKDNSDSKCRLLCTLCQLIAYIYMQHPTDRIAHTMAFVITVVEHRLEQEIADWVHSVTHLTMHKRSTTELHLLTKARCSAMGINTLD